MSNPSLDNLAYWLTERFGVLTKEHALKIAIERRLPMRPIPYWAVERGTEIAAARLLKECPVTEETLGGWQEFCARKPSFAHIFDRFLRAEIKGEKQKAPQNKASSSIAEKAEPDRDALMQYIELDFTLYAKKEFIDRESGKSTAYFADLQGRGKGYNTLDNSKITSAEQLDAAIKADFTLFGFQPKERDFVCIDIDCGHEGGGNGWQNYHAFLKNNGIEGNPLSSAKVIVDTPSGGNHLYFTARGETAYGLLLCDCVEVFGAGTAKTLTAAGSVKNGKVYRLHGNLKDATPLPRKIANFIAKDIFTEQAANTEKPKTRNTAGRSYQYPIQPQNTKTAEARRRFSLAQLVTWGIENAHSDSRNENARYIGLSVGRAYPIQEIIQEINTRAEFANRADFSDAELTYTLERAIRDSDFQ